MDKDIIELRSEKVRNIIGQIPPAIVRTGIGIIFLVFLILFSVLYFFECEDVIHTSADIKHIDSKLVAELKVPSDKYKRVKPGQKVRIHFTTIPNINNEQVEVHVQRKSEIMQVSSTGGFYTNQIELPDTLKTISAKKLKVIENINVPAEIVIGSTRLINKILNE